MSENLLTQHLLLPDETGECTDEQSQDRVAEAAPFDDHLTGYDPVYDDFLDNPVQHAIEERAAMVGELEALRELARPVEFRQLCIADCILTHSNELIPVWEVVR